MVAEFTVISGKIRENFRALHGMTWSEAQKNEARTMMQQLITAPVHSEIVGDRMRDFRTVGESQPLFYLERKIKSFIRFSATY